ncbi:hypothetical protein RclHR1_01080001 [Rhizophagus clarus]|uniref:Uncharacterized protein n=1 Tax=Rhizophagus clarus TaxID=94130 RepID=A0A2Z6Q415_9GLOM|nr:hypothetical protein RclHR1_01080001 [Rhizophagus clarus]
MNFSIRSSALCKQMNSLSHESKILVNFGILSGITIPALVDDYIRNIEIFFENFTPYDHSGITSSPMIIKIVNFTLFLRKINDI